MKLNVGRIFHKIIIEARNSYNECVTINNDWVVKRDCNRGWCLAEVLNELLKLYSNEVKIYKLLEPLKLPKL